MSSPDRDPAYLWDMLSAVNAIERFVEGKSFEDYQADELLRSAVERQIEIIGEAARRVSTDFQTAHADIPWRGIVAQRNVLADDYGEIDPAKIWGLATVHIQELITLIGPLLPPP